jgi:large subunit ribosomal protein L25
VSVTITVPAVLRTGRGKNENNRVRQSGKLPGVVYGSKKDPVAVTVNPKDIEKIFRSKYGYNTIVELDIDGSLREPSMIVDWQLDPVRDNIVHVDFKRIDMSKPVSVKVPVNFKGVPFGVKNQGGTIDTVSRSVAIECLPGDIPEAIDADVTGLRLGQSLRAGDLQLAEGMRLLTRSTQVLLLIAGTRASALAAEKEKEEAAKGGKK